MAALLLLTTTGQSAMPTNSLPTAETPALSATTRLVNGKWQFYFITDDYRAPQFKIVTYFHLEIYF